uniref:DUF3784 domain-containing protein n=1 Tax=Marseillevirus LCMAC102 TaxID=2506603 RepID=A0A481YSR3_9VIRU|nr:MAG: hypothetical protein LCMAC102_01180 [Marseillevirus LCMAC102]
MWLELGFFLLVSAIIIFGIYLVSPTSIPLLSIYRDPILGVCGYYEKRQIIRLFDIFLLGPVGIYIGYKIYRGESADLVPFLGVLIIIYGVLTVAYNGVNYVSNLKIE